MRRARILLLTAIVGLTLGYACAGVTARKHVMIPAMKKMWPSIERRATRGLDVGTIGTETRAATRAAMSSMAKMLSEGDIDRAAQIRWDLIKDMALLGIGDMLKHEEIGPGVAESLREGVRVFDEAFKRLVG